MRQFDIIFIFGGDIGSPSCQLIHSRILHSFELYYQLDNLTWIVCTFAIFLVFFFAFFCWLLLNPLLLTPRNIVFYAHSPFISHSRILPSPPHSSFTFFSLYFHSSSFTIQLCEAPAYLFGTIETKNVIVEFVIGLCKKTKHEHEKYRHTQAHTRSHSHANDRRKKSNTRCIPFLHQS